GRLQVGGTDVLRAMHDVLTQDFAVAHGLGHEVRLICLEQIPIADLWVRPAPALGVVTRFPEPENRALDGFSRFDGHSTFKACLVDVHANDRRRHTHPPMSSTVT